MPGVIPPCMTAVVATTVINDVLHLIDKVNHTGKNFLFIHTHNARINRAVNVYMLTVQFLVSEIK